MADPFLDRKPVKLSKNRSDAISGFCVHFMTVLQQHFALPVNVICFGAVPTEDHCSRQALKKIR